jgi:hypothetical protein
VTPVVVSVLVVLSVVDSVDVCVVISVVSVVASVDVCVVISVVSVVDSVDVCVVISVVSVVASVVVAITKYTLPSYDYQKKTMMKNIIMTYKFILVTIVTINMLIYI